MSALSLKQKHPELSHTASLFCKQPQQTDCQRGEASSALESPGESFGGTPAHPTNSNTAGTQSWALRLREMPGGSAPKDNESPAALPAPLLQLQGWGRLSHVQGCAPAASPQLHSELDTAARECQQRWDGSSVPSSAPNAMC